MPRERARAVAAVVLALGLHAVFACALRIAKVPRASDLAPASHEPAREEAVEVVVESQAPSGADGAPAPAVRVATARPRETPSRAEQLETAPIVDSSGGGLADAPPAEPAQAPASSAWSFHAFAQAAPTAPNIHPSGTDFALRNGRRAESVVPAPASTTGGLVEGLDAADVARGLGRGGPVQSAIAQAARGDGPVRGSATFSVTIFSDGRVAVEVASAQTDWSKLVEEIRSAVRSAKVRVPAKSRGLTVVVAVDASVRYPNGYEPPTNGTEIDASAKIGGAAPDAPVAAGAPRASVGVRGRRCSAGVAVTMGGLGASADCAAGNPARQVATRIVSEQRL